MRIICALLGMATAFATFHYARNGDVSQTIFCCFAMYILYDTLKRSDGK